MTKKSFQKVSFFYSQKVVLSGVLRSEPYKKYNLIKTEKTGKGCKALPRFVSSVCDFYFSLYLFRHVTEKVAESRCGAGISLSAAYPTSSARQSHQQQAPLPSGRHGRHFQSLHQKSRLRRRSCHWLSVHSPTPEVVAEGS